MRGTVRALLVTLALVAVAAPPARAAPSPNDAGCGFAGSTDPDPAAPADVVTGLLFGGPVTQNGTLTCTVQVGLATHTGTAAGSVSSSATSALGVVLVAPAVVTLPAPGDAAVYLCDRFVDGTTTWVWDAATNGWVDLAAVPGATCVRAFDSDDVVGPVRGVVQAIVDLYRQTSGGPGPDPFVCPLFALLAGDYGVMSVNAQGDVFVLGWWWWDCPPYDLDGHTWGEGAGHDRVLVAHHPPETLGP